MCPLVEQPSATWKGHELQPLTLAFLLHSAEKWSVHTSSGKVKKKPAALKVVPGTTQQQKAWLNREAANLQAMQWQTPEGHQATLPYAPALLDLVKQTDIGEGILAMR